MRDSSIPLKYNRNNSVERSYTAEKKHLLDQYLEKEMRGDTDSPPHTIKDSSIDHEDTES